VLPLCYLSVLNLSRRVPKSSPGSHAFGLILAMAMKLIRLQRPSGNPELEARIHEWEPNVNVINPPEFRERFKQHAASSM